MRVLSLLVLLGFTLVSPTAVLAQRQVSPPFSKLFRPPATSREQPSTPTVPFGANPMNKAVFPARPPVKIVCGMTLVPVDSSLDPKIEHPVPSTRTKFTLRTVKPPACRQ